MNFITRFLDKKNYAAAFIVASLYANYYLFVENKDLKAELKGLNAYHIARTDRIVSAEQNKLIAVNNKLMESYEETIKELRQAQTESRKAQDELAEKLILIGRNVNTVKKKVGK